MTRVLIDVDGVVCDFVSGYCELIRRVTGNSYLLSDITHWNFRECLPLTVDDERIVNELLFEPGVVRAFSALPDAYAGIGRLRSWGADVAFVTSPWRGHPTWAHERQQWLTERWPDIPIVSTAAKELIRGDALIDDKPENLERWLDGNPNGTALLWSAPYNRQSFLPRVFSWEQALRELEGP